MTFGGQYPSKSDRAYQGHADVLSRHGSCPLFSYKQYHPNDSDATPLLLVPTPFPFLRLIVPWSSWDSPTLPATLDLRPA